MERADAVQVLEMLVRFRMTCGCTVKERNSGHRLECNAPELQQLQVRAAKLLKGTSDEPTPNAVDAGPA